METRWADVRQGRRFVSRQALPAGTWWVARNAVGAVEPEIRRTRIIPMATRSRTTFQKRQKELARAERQREKAARRAQRKEQEPQRVVELTLEEAEALRS
jgi:hypothetical protein